MVLVHGIVSGPSVWQYFTPLITGIPAAQNFHVFYANYGTTSANGVYSNATIVLSQLQIYLNNFKAEQSVAAVQFDFVAHSMGGLVTRALPLVHGYLARSNYNLGLVHKLITIDTPHEGSQLAALLLGADAICQGLFSEFGKPIAGAVTDLAPGSILLSDALPQITSTTMPMHAIVGIASAAQVVGAILIFAVPGTACQSLPSGDSFPAVFGGQQGSDLIVGALSQAGPGGLASTSVTVAGQPPSTAGSHTCFQSVRMP